MNPSIAKWLLTAATFIKMISCSLKIAVLLLLLHCGCGFCAAQHAVEEALTLGLPVLAVETVGHEFPTFDPISAPDGCWGASITNATKVPGRIVLYDPTGAVDYDSGDYANEVAPLFPARLTPRQGHCLLQGQEAMDRGSHAPA